MNSSNKAVFFCDGSAKPNKGFGGFGVYGYIYKDAERSKNIKHPAHPTLVFTPQGVLKEKTEAVIEVTHILEVIQAINNPVCTNNEAEILAMICALEKTSQIENLSEVNIYTDSAYVVNAFNEYMVKWKTLGWKRQDHKEISHLNEWMVIDKYKEAFLTAGVKVNVAWVQGHDTSHGNIMADMFSVIASNSAKRQLTDRSSEFNGVIYDSILTYADYKKSYLDKDIVFFFRDLYFSSNALDDTNYCFLSSSDNPNNKGKRDTSSIFVTNIGYVPEIVNKFKALYRSIERDYVSTCCIRLTKIDNKEFYRLAHLINIEDLLIKHVDGKVIYYTLIRDTAPFLFENVIDYPFIVDAAKLYNKTIDISNDHKANSEHLIVRDITERIVKDNKIVLSNKDKSVDFTDIVSDTVYLKQKLLATVGYDMPSYLALKNIENDIQKVYLILETKPDSNYCTLFINIVMSDRDIYSVNIDNKYLRSTTPVVLNK